MTLALRKDKINDILRITEELNQIRDIDSLLDRVLLEARHFTHADAGSIYLVEKGQLKFGYVQNDTLARKDKANKYLYVDHTMPINPTSMAGYVALSQKPLVIDDAYHIDAELPCGFNRSFDRESSYRTRAVLTIPLKTSRGLLIGVMQIINPLDHECQVVPFSEEAKRLVSFFAGHAASAIEKAKMTREMILRMIQIAELHDPDETGSHVNRVGAYSIEIYNRWALDQGRPNEEIKRIRDVLRIAAMLHDVGKVAISDLLLKKSSELSDAEYERIKRHTLYGARLFTHSTSEWDDMAGTIALNHHERWDGGGYPGNIEDVYSEPSRFGPGKRGREIPLPARIVALADVYDALSSPRAYKEGWTEKQTLDYIGGQKEKHFDPDVTAAFFTIHDVIQAIKQRYR